MSTPRKMISPIKATRVSSEYGRRNPIPGVTKAYVHAGIDLAAAIGTMVVAAWGGVVVAAGWNIVGGRSGKGVLIRNPDGEHQYYGHLSTINVKVGQKVTGGQKIGESGATGNVTGPHLHFETWSSSRSTSHRNPRVYFEHWGIKPGSAPKIPAGSKPAKPATPSQQKKVAAPSAAVKRALKRMGLPQTTAGVEAYQKAHGLFVDGEWGGITQGYYEWVGLLQKKLNEWSAVKPKLVVDHYRGAKTKRAEAQVIAPNLTINRQKLGTTKAAMFRNIGAGAEPAKRG